MPSTWGILTQSRGLTNVSTHSAMIKYLDAWCAFRILPSRKRRRRSGQNSICVASWFPPSSTDWLDIKVPRRRSKCITAVVMVIFLLQISLVYLEDIIDFRKQLSRHMEHVRQDLCLFSIAAVELKLKRFILIIDEMDYFGDLIRFG